MSRFLSRLWQKLRPSKADSNSELPRSSGLIAKQSESTPESSPQPDLMAELFAGLSPGEKETDSAESDQPLSGRTKIHETSYHVRCPHCQLSAIISSALIITYSHDTGGNFKPSLVIRCECIDSSTHTTMPSTDSSPSSGGGYQN